MSEQYTSGLSLVGDDVMCDVQVAMGGVLDDRYSTTDIERASQYFALTPGLPIIALNGLRKSVLADAEANDMLSDEVLAGIRQREIAQRCIEVRRAVMQYSALVCAHQGLRIDEKSLLLRTFAGKIGEAVGAFQGDTAEETAFRREQMKHFLDEMYAFMNPDFPGDQA